MKDPTLAISRPARRQWTRVAEQARWVKDWEESEETQLEFARNHGLSVATLRNWVRHAVPATAVWRSGAPEFREVDLAQVLGMGANAADRSWDAEIRMPSGVAIAITKYPSFLDPLFWNLE
ncbi:MAG: hypothetical protein JNL97_10825 [Verrucomicrobiales bacterium]|nr:hypothetical protein [Verrucomicrobiales bacterium]